MQMPHEMHACADRASHEGMVAYNVQGDDVTGHHSYFPGGERDLFYSPIDLNNPAMLSFCGLRPDLQCS